MLELNVKGEWQGALSQADTCVHWCGHRTRESLCHGKRSVTSSVWTVPVAVKGGAPGLGDDSKASWLHLKTMGWVGKWTPFTFWTDRSCENLPCRSSTISSYPGASLTKGPGCCALKFISGFVPKATLPTWLLPANDWERYRY